MPTPTKGARLGGSPAHERLMLANLATALFEHGRITTTEAKAKRLRPFAERLITKARKADLHNRREIMRVIRDKDVVHKLVAEIGPHFVDRPGGYTRITKSMPRKGDNAPMAVIELVAERTATAEAERARGTRFTQGRSKHAAPAAAPQLAAADSPAADTPATDAPVAEAPATDVPDGDVPDGDAPVADAPVADVPAAASAAPGEPEPAEAQPDKSADKGES